MFPKPPQLTDLQNSAVVCITAGALYYFWHRTWNKEALDQTIQMMLCQKQKKDTVIR